MASQSQASSSKPRSMLPRTLVLVLSPISDVPCTKLRRSGSKKFRKVFEDFKQSNKQTISVQLQDAVDDIHFVGWISPFTLLIHGSTEDMDTIEHAWVGRMLKPPTGFIIKDFGVTSEVTMKQISQSQFISICDTLCEIVKGLNESQIAATFECVVSRLCSNFDSVVIPPKTAIKKSLDLLVGELRLDYMNGSYYFKSTATNGSKSRENIARRTSKIEAEVCNRRCLSSRKTGTKAKNNVKREDLKKCFEMKHDMERIKTKKFENTINSDPNRQRKLLLKKKELTVEENTKRKSVKNNELKSSSLKVRKLNHCIPHREYSYEKINSRATPNSRKLGCKKQIDKRNSFLGKLTRLFKLESSAEDEKLMSNDETDVNSSVEICRKGWEKIVTDEHAKLLSREVKVKRERVPGKTQAKKNEQKECKSINVSKKQISKTKYSGNLSRKARKKNKNYPLPLRRSLTNTSSRSRSPDLSRSPDHRSYSPSAALQKANWNSSYTRDQEDCPERYSVSSFSESSCSNLNNPDDSFSSESSVELARQSLDSEEDASDIESPHACWRDRTSNFCSTQAICGDLELSTLSLNPVNKTKSPDTSSMTIKRTEHLTNEVNKNEPLNHDCQQKNLRCRNLVQLIGVL